MEKPSPSPTGSKQVPQSMIHYVRRTRERVDLPDASAPNPFSSDPYLQSRRPRSILCLPVARKERLLGVLYFENDLAPGIFTEERVTVLETLAAQAAISLESAALFADLDRENVQRRRVELSLRESREQLQAILENMVHAVIVCDQDGRTTLVNQAAVRLFELADRGTIPPVAELSKSLRLRHPDGRPLERNELPLVRALAGDVVPSVEATITNRSERDVELRVSAAPIRNDEGRLMGAVAAITDVTEKVELERLRDQFLRMAAHELKTPVAVVTGYAERLESRRQELAPAQQRMLEALVRGTRKIDRIVSDLLFMWQLRVGRLDLVDEEIELGTLLRRVASRCEPAPGPSRVELSAEQPVVITGDRLLLEQVFRHLLDNALRFSPDGGNVEANLVVPPAGGVEVSVRDHGIGIAKDKQPRIFEPFYRAHAETAYDFGGMGVGLYVSNVIVRRHGGAIRFVSREGEGSTFTVWLPNTTERHIPNLQEGSPRKTEVQGHRRTSV
ncbi:MAG: Signal transduction histidine kinase CheA [Labilithrix sp.]|nr:Signal transduction histidine kinase CheA [Labilithrix sp.]